MNELASERSDGATMGEPKDGADQPALRIVSGSPTSEELAALTAVMAAASGGDDEPAPPVRRGSWNDPAAQFRPPLLPGPNGWRAPVR